MGDGLGHLRVVVRQRRAAADDRAAGKTSVRGELEADHLVRQAVDGSAPENPALRLEQVAVDRLGAEQARHLVHEALEDGVQLELARDHLRRLEQRALLAEPPFVLFQEAGRMDRESDLVRHRLGHGDVALRPRTRFRPVHAEHADHPVEDDHRRRQDCPRAESIQRLAAAEERVVELGRRAHVGNGDRAKLTGREVGGRQALDGLISNWLEAFGKPFGAHRQALARLAEPDEAARCAEGAPGLRDRHARDGVEIVDGADAARDLGDQALAGQRLVERSRRAGAVECDGRLPRDRLHQPELLGRERPPLTRARGHQHADHALVHRQWHEGGAFRADRRRQAAADERRGLDVVDGQRRRVEVGARDARGLAAEVEAHLGPPVDVLGSAPRDKPVRLAAVVAHECERRELDAHQRDDLVEQRPAGGDRVLHPREGARQACHGVELAIAERDQLLGLASPGPAQKEVGPVAPARQAYEHRRDEPDQAGGERRPDVAADRPAVPEDDHAEDRERDPDSGKDEGESEVGDRGASPLTPQRRSQHGGHQEVRSREHDQGNGVEIDSLVFGGHWAL